MQVKKGSTGMFVCHGMGGGVGGVGGGGGGVGGGGGDGGVGGGNWITKLGFIICLPEASFGLRVLSLPAYVYPSITRVKAQPLE